MTNSRTGGCLCGRVRYESVGGPIFSLLCHCRDCQHQSGGAYIAAMRVPAAGFRLTRGEPRLHVSMSDAGNEVTRAFCGDCGCPLYIRVSARADIVGLRVGSLDDPGEFRPEADIFVKSAQPWDHMDPALPKHPTYPPGRAYTPEK
ncbi:MAG: GFA family protein [Stellaceae bacterium]